MILSVLYPSLLIWCQLRERILAINARVLIINYLKFDTKFYFKII